METTILTPVRLRYLFDTEKVDLLAINIIAEARLLGYEGLAEEMIRDLSISARFFEEVSANELYIRRKLALLEEQGADDYQKFVDRLNETI